MRVYIRKNMMCHSKGKKMYVFVVCLLIVAASANDANRIIGGHDVSIEEYPYQLSLLRYMQHTCGASLLNENFAITAAHCTYERKATDLLLRAGTDIRNSGGIYLHIKTLIQHPQYSPKTIDNDISILGLFMPVKFTPKIQPIKLPQPNSNYQGLEAICSGWGHTTPEGSPSQTLKAVELQIYDDNKCRESYNGKITEHMLCAANPGKDACAGDSGGPLVVNGELVGLVSWGYTCADPNHPGVFTKVTSELDFINEAMNGKIIN